MCSQYSEKYNKQHRVSCEFNGDIHTEFTLGYAKDNIANLNRLCPIWQCISKTEVRFFIFCGINLLFYIQFVVGDVIKGFMWVKNYKLYVHLLQPITKWGYILFYCLVHLLSSRTISYRIVLYTIHYPWKNSSPKVLITTVKTFIMQKWYTRALVFRFTFIPYNIQSFSL